MDNNLDNLDFYKYAVENIGDLLWQIDKKLTFTFLSPSVQNILGFTQDELIGKNILNFLTKESKNYIISQLTRKRTIESNGNFKYVVQFKCKDKKAKWFEISTKTIYEDGAIVGYIGTSRDITERINYESKVKLHIEELKQNNLELNRLATKDPLTGAYNRRIFENFFKVLAHKNQQFNTPFSIIMLDIDYFKQINDTFGHNVGDQVLFKMTMAIKETIRNIDVVIRWGGEEFIIIVVNKNLDYAKKIAQKIQKAIRLFNFGIPKSITVSMGICEYLKGQTIEQSVENVDKALLKAKSKGRNRTEIYNCKL